MSEYISLEQDPASGRLTPAQVVDIHHMHRGAIPWDVIAEKHHITRKTVQRIVQGRRWKQFHPAVRPDLYNPQPPTARRYTLDEIDRAAVAAAEAFRTALQPTVQMPPAELQPATEQS